MFGFFPLRDQIEQRFCLSLGTETTDLVSAIGALPTTYLDASSRLERGCAARSARAGSFVVRAREAAQVPPDIAITTSRLEPCPQQEFAP